MRMFRTKATCATNTKGATMISLNTDHPGYDLAMEILASLGQYPDGTSMSALAKDFGFTDQFKISAAIAQLCKRGFPIITWNEQGRKAAVKPFAWQRARTAAREYVGRVWTQKQ